MVAVLIYEICSKSTDRDEIDSIFKLDLPVFQKKCFIGGVLKLFCDFKPIILKSPIPLKLQVMCYM